MKFVVGLGFCLSVATYFVAIMVVWLVLMTTAVGIVDALLAICGLPPL